MIRYVLVLILQATGADASLVIFQQKMWILVLVCIRWNNIFEKLCIVIIIPVGRQGFFNQHEQCLLLNSFSILYNYLNDYLTQTNAGEMICLALQRRKCLKNTKSNFFKNTSNHFIFHITLTSIVSSSWNRHQWELYS